MKQEEINKLSVEELKTRIATATETLTKFKFVTFVVLLHD